MHTRVCELSIVQTDGRPDRHTDTHTR